jgi:hypothetical protein
VEQVKAFRVLPKALDPEEEGEPVTPTRKVKRNAMYERFRPLVEEMYAGQLTTCPTRLSSERFRPRP